MLTCLMATKQELVMFSIITGVATVLFGSAIYFCEKDKSGTNFISIPSESSVLFILEFTYFFPFFFLIVCREIIRNRISFNLILIPLTSQELIRKSGHTFLLCNHCFYF